MYSDATRYQTTRRRMSSGWRHDAQLDDADAGETT